MKERLFSKTTFFSLAAGVLIAVQPFIQKGNIDWYQAGIAAAIFCFGFFSQDNKRNKTLIILLFAITTLSSCRSTKQVTQTHSADTSKAVSVRYSRDTASTVSKTQFSESFKQVKTLPAAISIQDTIISGSKKGSFKIGKGSIDYNIHNGLFTLDAYLPGSDSISQFSLLEVFEATYKDRLTAALDSQIRIHELQTQELEQVGHATLAKVYLYLAIASLVALLEFCFIVHIFLKWRQTQPRP